MKIIENNISASVASKPSDIISVTSRVNNSKRNYLLLNKLQAKYIPVKAGRAFGMFDNLAGQIKGVTGKIIVIGFAETATAIGARIAYQMAKSHANTVTLLTTTREHRDITPVCEFKEEHSHAVEQILYGDDKVFSKADWIVFAEDEVTTGNTIRNCVSQLKGKYSCRYAVASVLNCMSDEEMDLFHNDGIEAFYLLKTDKDGLDKQEPQLDFLKLEHDFIDIRTGVDPLGYTLYCKNTMYFILNEIKGHYGLTALHGKKILVLGTEECMYPAIKVSEYLNHQGYQSFVSASTRVPTSIEGPVTNRNMVPSLYGSRDTYLYNLKHYDFAVIVTDADGESSGMVDVLWKQYGISNIIDVRLKLN